MPMQNYEVVDSSERQKVADETKKICGWIEHHEMASIRDSLGNAARLLRESIDNE